MGEGTHAESLDWVAYRDRPSGRLLAVHPTPLSKKLHEGGAISALNPGSLAHSGPTRWTRSEDNKMKAPVTGLKAGEAPEG